MDKHGVDGPARTRCGIVYTEAAKGCVHLVWDKNVLHFTYKKEVCEITIDKFVFDPIFQIAKKMYSELISHKLYAEQKNYVHIELSSICLSSPTCGECGRCGELEPATTCTSISKS
jgi:hypothetical protein